MSAMVFCSKCGHWLLGMDDVAILYVEPIYKDKDGNELCKECFDMEAHKHE